ncbi:MAG TPA: DegT/DnrJ/EryC1/StrS family aminotransferase [Solirubrobacteraceae bacterium]|jgi:dTDP-4-amino-4,6-dideoxygalactose transaminase|nr:DegT/DnrJ/EryC1/StrS family aminotransferase [Solirubrobacteraceae bacterium]
MRIPLFDIKTPLQPFQERLAAAATATLAGGTFILGPEVEAFEREFAEYLGARHVVGVANGTDAITIALRAMGVGPGDEVIVPAFTFYASAEAIPPTGARPVFCDVDPETMMVTPETVKAALTPATKAVIAVHLFGNVAPVREIEALGVPVLEDAAQAAGSRGPDGRPGALGTAATFSFYPTKNLGAMGDGGAIATASDEIAGLARTLRAHGSRDQSTWQLIGYNSRLDELQAAFLRILLPELDGWSEGRARAGGFYAAAGLGELVELPEPAEGAVPAWHVYVIRTPAVDAIAATLAEAGIGAKVYYRPGLHRHPALAPYAQGLELQVTDELAGRHLAIPIGPTFSQAQAEQVTASVATVLAPRSA